MTNLEIQENPVEEKYEQHVSYDHIKPLPINCNTVEPLLSSHLLNDGN